MLRKKINAIFAFLILGKKRLKEPKVSIFVQIAKSLRLFAKTMKIKSRCMAAGIATITNGV